MPLSAHHVDYRYDGQSRAASGQTWAVRDAGAETRSGQLLGIIGPNGSGKSTLLRILAGQLIPQKGRVTLDGADVRTLRREALARRVAFLPQRVESTFAFTCEEVVAQGRYPRLSALGFLSREDVEIVHDCMERTDTRQFTSRPLDALSGGERQRVLIASILAQQADYLLLDEPTASLDINHQAEVFTLLRRSSRDGLAVAVVVHDLNLAAQFCDRLILMSVGQVVAEGAPDDVLHFDRLAPVYGGNIVVAENPVTKGPLVTVLAPREQEREETPCPS